MEGVPDVTITYPMIQALLSIIIGLCLSRIWMVFATHVKNWKNTKSYLPYYILMFSQTLTLMTLWFQSPFIYGILIKVPIKVLVGLTGDGCAVIMTYLALPSDKELDQDYLNLEKFYLDNKRKIFVAYCIWATIGSILGYSIGVIDSLLFTLINISFTLMMGVLMWFVNNYWFHLYAHVQATCIMILLVYI